MDEKQFPQYSSDAYLGNKGRRLVENAVHESMGWLFREVAKDDLGIDGFVEVIREDKRSTGRLFATQIKCGHSYLAERTDEGYVYRGRLEHLNYWIEFSLQVVLMLCDPDTNDCYWVEITPANVVRLEQGWKVVVPRSQKLTKENKWRLELVVSQPQAKDIIPLALYRLLVEKFHKIVIAPELETPHDFWGFEFLARLDGAQDELTLITHIYKPTESFAPADVDEILHRRDVCAGLCGWNRPADIPKIIVFFIAHKVEQLQLSQELVTHLANQPDISYFRAVCDFVFGVSLAEIDSDNEYILFY